MSEKARKLKPVESGSLRSRVSPEEWEVRCELAAAYQLAAQFRWTDLIFTHFTARVPGSEYILINPYGLMFDEITASTIVKIDHAGNVIEDVTGLGINYAGYVIHGCMHEARPEVNCVIHTHTRAGVAVSAQKHGLLPLSQHALRTYGMLTYHDYEGIALELDERGRMAADLGKTSKAMILRNHGLLTLGDSVAEAFELMYYLDTACQIQIDALAGGRVEVGLIDDKTAGKGYQQFQGPNGSEVSKAWEALVRMLDRKGINYRN
ncbi:MAG TPA: class II aldolase/adducin family protein [Burkholderiales bacterium]|nr:class II aldolase/adducin family protein [Burkholderiales bacterium]